MAKGLYRFVVYKDVKNYWRWRFVAPNGEIVATAEGYRTKRALMRSITLLQSRSPEAALRGKV